MEKAGIPTVTLGFADQINFFKNVALTNGCPNIRFVAVPRVGSGDERVAIFWDAAIKALTDPLTTKEKESGLYSPPSPARIMFEGTMDEAQDFFQQTVLVENCRQCPIAKYTDGLPVIIPTEEKVAAMLTGTSHKPTETIATQIDSQGWGAVVAKGAQITFAQNYTATVEKVAVTAVMAGCKPQYMPICLAIATSGGNSTNCPGTSSAADNVFIVSGPFAKEIGMNAGQEAMDVGNPANMTLGRVGALMTVNFGGCITGIVRSDNGNPIHSVTFAEDLDGLPKGWVGMNQESVYYDSVKKANVNYSAKETVLMALKTSMTHWMQVQQHAPGSYRQMNEGYGGVALRIYYRNIEWNQTPNPPMGTMGPRNWLMTIVPDFAYEFNVPTGGHTFVFHPNMAYWLWEYGFDTKEKAYRWMENTFYTTAKWVRAEGWYDFMYDAGRAVEPTSGIAWKDLPDDFKVAACGSPTQSPSSNCFIVANGIGADELVYTFAQSRGSTYPIDPWK